MDRVGKRLAPGALRAKLSTSESTKDLMPAGVREKREESAITIPVCRRPGAPLAVEAHEVGDVLADERPSLASGNHQQLFVGEPAQRAALINSLGLRAPLAQRSRQAGGVHLVQQQLHTPSSAAQSPANAS